jgi:hypothetical protein
MRHLFIIIKPTHVIFNDGEIFGQDPAPTDTDKLKTVIGIINHHGKDATVEIRDDRDDLDNLIAAQNHNADTTAGVQYV